jgi:hypothetical protein
LAKPAQRFGTANQTTSKIKGENMRIQTSSPGFIETIKNSYKEAQKPNSKMSDAVKEAKGELEGISALTRGAAARVGFALGVVSSPFYPSEEKLATQIDGKLSALKEGRPLASELKASLSIGPDGKIQNTGKPPMSREDAEALLKSLTKFTKDLDKISDLQNMSPANLEKLSNQKQRQVTALKNVLIDGSKNPVDRMNTINQCIAEYRKS